MARENIWALFFLFSVFSETINEQFFILNETLLV